MLEAELIGQVLLALAAFLATRRRQVESEIDLLENETREAELEREAEEQTLKLLKATNERLDTSTQVIEQQDRRLQELNRLVDRLMQEVTIVPILRAQIATLQTELEHCYGRVGTVRSE